MPSDLVPPGVIITQKRKRKMIDVDSGILTVTTNKRQRKRMDYRCEYMLADFDTNEVELRAEIIFKPKTSQSMLTVSISRSSILCNTFSDIPRLFITNILPVNSWVFQLAATGTVEELLSLVAKGEASLRDHDTKGKSLLHVSIDGEEVYISVTEKPQVCRSEPIHVPVPCPQRFRRGRSCVFRVCRYIFLSETSSVDEKANNYICSTPLHSALMRRAEKTADILLEAGADPTISCLGWTSVLHLVSLYNHSVVRHESIWESVQRFDQVQG